MNADVVFVYASYAFILLMSFTVHEFAHAWVAYKCGDDTAYLMGRLTLNPLKHIDPFLTILLPAACMFMGITAFGGAKPVPVNPGRFRRPLRDDRLVSLAGVAANLLAAFVLAQALRLALDTGVFTPDSPGTQALVLGILSNLLMFVFNLTPIPPLDGSRVLRSFLPWEARHVFNMLDRWGMFIVFLLVQIPGLWGWMYEVIVYLARHVILMPLV